MRWRTAGRVAATVLVGLLVPGAAATAGIARGDLHRRDYPAVRWQDRVAYVDDGDGITTGGVLSGVNGALRVVERIINRRRPCNRPSTMI